MKEGGREGGREREKRERERGSEREREKCECSEYSPSSNLVYHATNQLKHHFHPYTTDIN